MTEKIIFLVDEFNETKTYGWTTNIDKVLHNIGRLPRDWALSELNKQLAASEEGLTYFMTAGRFIIFLVITKNKDKGSMAFFDTRNDDDFAMDFSKSLGKEHWRTEFIKQHFLNKPHYFENFELVDLSNETFMFN